MPVAPRIRTLPTAGLATLVLAAAGSATGCCATRPTPSDWLAVGYRSPEQTVATFRTAVAADQPDLEYRCLSSGFRRERGGSQLAYREFRAALLAEHPEIRRLAGADLEPTRELGDGRAEVVAVVSTLFVTARVRFELVREDYWELWRGRTLLADGLADFAALATPPEIHLPPEAASAGAFTELRVGREWKIDAIEPIAEP